ncbi:hypothetical protein [Hahella ganghwensis]|uniref:hypothetical protein n=1 Tax=Hahella ganghwensis TaxID=286420 RepID=UPI00035DDBB2|nr:hypothetical protein [Hahella ganghwensis]
MYDLTKDRRRFDRRLTKITKLPEDYHPETVVNRRRTERRRDNRPLQAFPYLPHCEI